MIAHLAARGHRTVGVYPGAPYPGALPGDEMALRIRGMAKAARQHGVELQFLRPSSYEAPGINEAIRDLIRRGCPCTAVAALTDTYAQLVLNELEHGGVAVPDRVSLVGYDDQSFDAFLPVPLTSVRQPVAEIARVLARVVNEVEPGRPIRLRRQLAPVLIERASVRDLRHPVHRVRP